MGEEKINNPNPDPKDQKEQSKTDENLNSFERFEIV